VSMDALIPHVIASIAIIIGISYLAGAGMHRLGQPAVIGQILAGIVLGPSILGRLPGDPEAILIPQQTVARDSKGNPVALILTTATSVFGSVATTRPLNCRRSARMTSTSTASATT